MNYKAPEIIELDRSFCTTRRVIKVKPEDVASIVKSSRNSESKIDPQALLPQGKGRRGEGGLRTKGYFKVGGIIPAADFCHHQGKDKPFPVACKKPLITIITAVFNGEKYLEETILSVIKQTYDNVEYIIIDGGSTDKTVDIIKKYEHAVDYWVSERDGGMYDAIHKGFSIAFGSVFAWINADDRYNQGAFEIVLSAMEKYNSRWITGVPTVIDSNGVVVGVEHPKFYSRKLVENGFFRGDRLGFIQQESTFFSSRLYRAYPLKTHLKFAGDFHLWCSFAKDEQLITVKTCLASFRIHRGQKSSNMQAYLSECDELDTSFFWRIVQKISLITSLLKASSVLMDWKFIKPIKHL